MPSEKPLQTLYKALKEQNFDVPESYESFEKTLTEAGENGAESRHTIYKALKEQNYDVPENYESFYSTLFVPVNNTTSKARGTEEQPTLTPAKPEQAQSAHEPAKPVNNSTSKARGTEEQPTLTPVKPATSVVPRSSNYLRDVTGDARNVVGSLVVSPAEVMGNERTGTEGAEVVGGKNLIKNPQNAKETWNEGMLSRDAFDRLYKYYSQASEGNSTNFTKLNDLIAKDKDLSNVPTSDLQDLLQQAIGLNNKKSAAIIAYNIVNDLPKGVGQEEMQDEINKAFFRYGTLPNMAYISDVGAKGAQGAGEYSGQKFYDEVKQYIGEMLQAQRGYSKNEATQLTSGLGTTDIRKQGKQFDERWMTVPEQNLMNVLFAEFKKKVSELGEKGERVGKEHYNKEMRDVQPATGAATGAVGFQGLLGIYPALQEERIKNRVADPSQAIESVINRLYAAQGQGSGGSLPTEDIDREAIGKLLYRKMMDYLVQQHMPKNKIEYVLKGFADSDIGNLLSSYTKTNFQRYLDDLGNARAIENWDDFSGLLAQGGHAATQFIADAWEWAGAGKVGGLLANSFKKRAVKRLAGEFVEKGINKKAAREIAERVFSQQAMRPSQRALLSSLHGAGTLGVQGFGSTAMRQSASGVGDVIADIQSREAQGERISDKDKQLAIAQAQKERHSISNVLSEGGISGLRSAGSGALFGAGSYIGSLAGSLAGKYFGDVANYATDRLSSLSSNALNVSLYDKAIAAATGQEDGEGIGEHFANNFITFGMLELLGIHKSPIFKGKNGILHPIKNIKEWKEHERQTGISADDESTMEAAGYGDLTGSIDKLVSDRFKTEETTEVSKTRTTEGASKINEQMLQMLSDPRLSEELKRKYYVLVTGDNSKQLSPAVSANIVESDDGIHVVTRNATGDVIQDRIYQNRSIARDQLKKITTTIDKNLTEALESACFENDANEAIETAYINAKNKLQKGEPTTEQDDLILSFKSPDLQAKYERAKKSLQSGETPTDSDLSVLSMYDRAKRYALENYTYALEIRDQVEKKYGIGTGGLDKAIEGHTKREAEALGHKGKIIEVGEGTYRTEEEQKAIAEYQRLLLDHASKKKIEDIEEANVINGDKNNDDNNANPVSEEKVLLQEHTEDEPVPSENNEPQNFFDRITKKKEEAYQRGVAIPEDERKLSDIQKRADIAHSRLEEAFANNKELGKLFVEAISSQDEENFAKLLKENELSAEQQSAIEGLVETYAEQQGVEDAIEDQLIDYEDERSEALELIADSNGQITKLTLDDGSEVFLKSGDITNEYGGVIVTDDEGNTRQIPVRAIKAVDAPISVDEQIRKEGKEFTDHLTKSYQDIASGEKMIPGQDAVISIAGEKVHVTMQGETGDGRLVLRLDDESDIALLPEDLADCLKAARREEVETTLQEDRARKAEKAEQKSLLSAIPKDEEGNPRYEEADAETSYDAILEQTDGDEHMADDVIQSMISDKKSILKKAEKTKVRAGKSISDKIAAEKERKEAIESARAELESWEKIAAVPNKRRQEAERKQAEAERQEAEEERKKKEAKQAEEAKKRADEEEAARKEREAIYGVPDWTEDTATDARARGYRRADGKKYSRQGKVEVSRGKDVGVKFSDKLKATGYVALIEAEKAQPSHINGQANVLHFIPEAQPKKRTDEASSVASEEIAANINPEEITSSVIAYTGAPSVNERGEGIQGNNRLASLKTMWRRYPKQAEKYRQYLLDHAEEFGLSKEEIEKSKHPILVNVLPVTDAKAIELGQYDDKDITSGGTERIKAKNIVVKMGGDMKTFANRLLSSSDDDMSFAQLIDKNGIDVLKWLQSKHYISATQYKSAFNSRGNLTAEASNDLKSIMYQSIFTDGSERLEEMFNAMPAKAQKAILATAYRDYDSPSKDKMVPELQKSIMAFYELSKDEAFANATSMKDVRNAIETWRRQYQFDDATGESFLPTNKYSNFALELAAIYKSQTQRYMQSVFNSMYDLIQGRREADIFSQGNVDNRPRTLSEAIKEVLKIDYNGKTGSNIVGVGSETGIERRRGSTGDVERGGRGTEGERAADGNGRAKGDAGEEGVAPFSERLQNAIAETETEPTEAQKKAGNYKKGHLSFGGYDFTVETPKGVTRSGKDEQGKPWSVTMHDTYGYILGKIGVDGDHIDMFINDAADLDTFDGNVYVVDQVNPETGEFDEHKVMYGYPSEEAATEAYLANYSKGWKGLGKVTSVSKATFDKWLESSDRKTKPFADYAMVQKEQAKTNSDFIAQMEYDYENDIHPSEEDKPKMQKFVERLLNFHSDKEDKIDSGYTILSSNIQGDKLYPNEKKWFGTKKYRQGVSWVDKENACAYELNPRFNAQGYLTAVGVHKLVPLASFGRDVNEVKPSDIARATGKSQGKVTAKASKKQGKGEKKVEPGQQVDYYSAFAEQYGLDAEEAKKEAVANASEKAKEVKGLSNKLKDRYPTSLYLLGRDISDMEEMVANGEVSPKRVERVRSEIKRLKGLLADYERLATPEERSWRHKKAEHPDEIVVVDRGNGLLVVCQEDVKATNKAIGHKLDAPVTENLIVTTNEEQGMPFTTMRVTLADLQRLDDKGVKYVVLDKNGNQAKAKSKKQGKGEKKVEPGQQVDYYSAFAEQYGLDEEEAKKETEGNKPSEASLSLSTPLTDEEVVAITDAMKANATVAPTVEINDANWKESVETPVGSVKMGENQKAKLFAKGREQQYGMLLETLSNPDVVLEEKDKEQNMFHERPSSYLFVKTFQKEDGSKYVHFESVTVSQEGMEVSISSHIIRENQLKNKLKSDRLLYKATALDAPANTSAEQPIVGGSLSSDGKDTEKGSSGQEDGEKNVLSDLEREFQKALEHEEDVEQKWEVKIQDYVAEHYPTQATVSAETKSAKGLEEREAMKSDSVLRAMREKADAENKKAADATFAAWKKMEASKEKMEAREHKADVVENPSHGEEVLRDAVIDKLRESGIEVLGATEGQKVLDMANGKDVRLEAKRKRALETASVSRDEKHQPTVVSSADGAKILNNLDTLATEYDNLKNYPKTFTGDVAKALGADRFGSGSEYATFETKNGQIVTIRLANHNARVSGFDHNKRDNGISIVISSKPNAGITNNGDAHIVEFYYDSIKLRRADGKPLAEIVRSIKQALYSGVFKDPTGLAERQEVNADDVISLQKVYHGSGADFDHFDHSHMGEGEGAQAYGWGTYVKITDHVRFFKTKNGEAYGFTVGGKIYIDPRIANAETPIHEYAHLWGSALRSGNPKEWENVVGLMKGTPVWDEVKKRYPELETDEEIADEVIATYSGRRGAERLRREAAKIAGSMDELDAVKALSALQRVKEALKRFWKGVCDFLHIHFTSAEEVADRVMKDLLDGVDPRKFMKGKDGKPRFQFIGERGAAAADHAEEVNTRIDNLAVAREMEEAKKDAKAIKMATGWERGADGKWRYEIPDAKIKDTIDVGGGNIVKRFEEDILWNDGKLEDAVDAPKLFEAYPQLKNIKIHTDAVMNYMPSNGYYNPQTNTITIHAADLKYLNSILNHEIQHAIQNIEGFAQGGNSKTVRSRIQKIIDDEKDASEYAKSNLKQYAALHMLASRLKASKQFAKSDQQFFKDKAREYYWDAMNELDNNERSTLINEYPDDKNAQEIAESGYHVDEAIKELKRIADEYKDEIPKGNMDAFEKVNKLTSALENKSDDELYQDLAGEVEARNVQKRMGMTPEERRNSLASETEDVDRGDQIVMNNGGTSYSIVKDPETIKKLDKEDTVKVYRAMQVGEDGKLYPPMAAKVKGKFVQPIELGKWEQADERPELADDKGMFTLNKGNGKSLKAAYNPYLHTSRTPLNDQFSEAQNRPNIVTVEVEVPKSELTSGYKADKAKDAVGEVEWKAGIIQGQLTGKRKVILSRWDKPVRIVPDSEVADVIVNDMFKGKNITMPSNVVTPSLRKELEKRGVPFVETDNRGRIVGGENDGVHYSKVYGKKANVKHRLGEPYDYEKYPLGRVEPNLATKEVKIVHADVSHGFKNYKEAKDWAKQNIAKVYSADETGNKGEVRISNSAIDKFLSQSAVDKSDTKDVHLSVLKVLPEVLKESIDAETHPDFLKGANGKRSAENGMNKDVLVHRCYGAVDIDGKVYRVKITLKEDLRDKSFPHVTHSYEATKIELLAGTWENPSKSPSPNTNNSISGAILLKNVEMSYNNRKNLLDESEKMGIPAENQRKIADSVIDTANQLGGAEAHVYTSFVDVPEEYKKEVEKGARGWYDPETHTVHVYLPNCASGDEAQRTVFHEKIGHEGIEVLFGGEEGVKDFAKFVFSSSGKEIREKVMEIADQYDPEWKHPDRTNVGTQEYIAKLAENGPQTAEEFSLWRKIKHYLIKAMKKLGLTIRGLMNDKDLRYYLLRAQQSLHVWDKMPEAKKRAMAEQASETEMKESLSNRPRKRKNETTAQYIERLRQWEKWKIALDKASVANDPLPEEETYHDKWDKQYRTDMEAWRKANDIAEGAEGPSEAPKRAEGESPQEYALRVADHERELDLWQGAPDYFSYLKKAQEDYRKAYEAWKERYDIDEMENVDLQLYGGETPTEGPADEDAYQEQEEIEHNVNSEFEKEMGAACGIDMSAEGARRKAIIAVIDRRKNLEGASAEDAIFIGELCKEIDALEKELGLGKGELRNELIHIIEQPLQQQEADAELERWVDLLNSMRVFHDAHSKVTVEGVKAVQPELQKLANVALKYGANPKDKSEREELHAASREVADALNRYYQDVPGYHGLYGDDIIKIAKYAQHVAYAALLTQRSNELADNPKVRKIVEKIKNWYDEFFHLLEDAGLRGDAGYIGEGYVNHIWDKERSDQEAYERYVENYQRTKSSNMRHREIATYLDGIGVGLVPKFTDIGQIMSYYSRQNNEAIANRKFLDALSFLTIAHKNNDGEVTEVLPILNSHKPDRLDEEKYEMFHVPGIGDVWVLKEVAGKFSTIFGTMRTKDIPNWLSKLGKNYDLLASTMKKIQLSVSGFHALALSEVALAQMGPIKGMQAILKYILYDSAKHGWQVPAYVHTEDYKMAAKHLVQLGATQDYASADVNMITERFRKFVKNLSEDESFMKKVSGNALQPFAVAVDWINKGTDKLLWNYLHDGLKIACFKMMKEKIDRMAARKGLSETTRDRLLDEAGQYVNDTFGGQYWELLNIPPAALKWLRRLFLSPDWLISTMRHFFANFGRGSIYDPRNFLDYIRRVKEEGEDIYKYIPEEDIKEFRRFRQRSALYCYVLGVCVFYYTMMNALNALSRVKDVEKEKAKADEIRKTNPSYKSPYELAYPDGIKWYDYTMWGNSLGQQTHLFLGRYKDGTEMYVRWGKQFREFPELFIGRKGLDFPAPLIERMMGKANPVIGLIKDDLGALGIYGFNRSKEDEQLQEKYGKTIGLLAMNARHFLPFSLPTREDKEGKLIDLFMPSSKGFSRYKAIDYFKDFIKSGDMAGITKTYRAAMLNGIDAEKCLQAAITTLKAEQSEVLRSGVTDLSKAFAAYNNAKTLKEKKTLRTTLMKYLAASEYKAFTRDEAIKEVQDYLSGDAIETEKDNEKYILKSKAEDIRDDFRMSRIYNQSKKYVDNIKQAAKNGDREKSSQLRDRYSSWIEIYGISRKERTAVGKLKKMLGKGNDEAVMREIRNVRRQCQQEIDKVSPVR